MEMTGERRIPAPRQKVWNALNDPEVLRTSIPGCQSLEKISDNELKAIAAVRVGPIAARFTGLVQLSDLDPPNSYRISGEGQGGVAGFAKGGAQVNLADDGDFTLLRYAVNAQVGGKIAQLGGRLIDATAKQMADNFFDRFTAEVAGPPEAAAEGLAGMAASAAGTPPGAAADTSTAAPAPAAVSILSMVPRQPYGFPLVAWIGGIIFILIFLLIFSAYL